MNWKKILKAPPVKRDEAYKNMREDYKNKIGRPAVGQLAKDVDNMIKQFTKHGKLKYFVSWEVGDANINMFYDEYLFNTGNVWDAFDIRTSSGADLMENLYRIWKKESDAEVTLTKDFDDSRIRNNIILLTIKLADDVEYDNTDEPNDDKPKKRWWRK